MKFSGGLPRVALADSLTRGYFLKPLRGFSVGMRNIPTPLSPLVLSPGQVIGLGSGRPE